MAGLLLVLLQLLLLRCVRTCQQHVSQPCIEAWPAFVHFQAVVHSHVLGAAWSGLCSMWTIVTQLAKFEATLPSAVDVALKLLQTSINGSMHVSLQAAAGPA